MTFQSQKSPQTQTDVILPVTAAATLRSFNQTLLFDAAMKMFNLPTVTGIFDALQIAHFNLRTRPMLRRAVRGNVAKHSDQSVTFEPDRAPIFANLDLGNRLESFPVGVDLPVRFQSGSENASQARAPVSSSEPTHTNCQNKSFSEQSRVYAPPSTSPRNGRSLFFHSYLYRKCGNQLALPGRRPSRAALSD